MLLTTTSRLSRLYAMCCLATQNLHKPNLTFLRATPTGSFEIELEHSKYEPSGSSCFTNHDQIQFQMKTNNLRLGGSWRSEDTTSSDSSILLLAHKHIIRNHKKAKSVVERKEEGELGMGRELSVTKPENWTLGADGLLLTDLKEGNSKCH